MFPVAEQKNAERAAQLIPKLLATGELFVAQTLIKAVGQIQDLMDVESQKIQKEKHHRQMLFAVTEIVFNVIALIFEGVEGLVFDFPTASACLDQLDDVIGVHRDIGHPGVSVGHLATDDNLIIEKVHVIGFFASVNGYLIDPAVTVTAFFDIHQFQRVGLSHGRDLLDVFKQDFVVCGFGHQNKGHSLLLACVDEGLFGKQAVTADDKWQFGMGFAQLHQKPFGGIDFTILFFGSVAVGNPLRGKGQHLLHVRMHDNRLDDVMMIAHTAVLFLSQTPGAVDMLGTEVLGPVDGNQVSVAPTPDTAPDVCPVAVG